MHRLAAAASVLLAAVQSLAAPAASTPETRSPQPNAACSRERGEVLVAPGVYQPFFKRKQRRDIPVAAMCLSAGPVTNGQFLAFVRDHPEWRRSRVERLFAEDGYLAHWQDDLQPPADSLAAPVTYVSWFAASAYCEARGAHLPYVSEWERFAGGQDSAKPTSSAGSQPFAFAMGRRSADLAHLPLVLEEVWEWTEDFNSSVVAGRIGSAADADTSLFCGDGFRAVNATDYAAFLRYSFRSSLRAAFTLRNLGFRCAREAP